MKRPVFCGLMFLLLLILSFPVFSQHLKRSYTLSSEDLTHAGLIRLSDILRLIDEMDSFTIDGYTWQGVLNPGATYRQQNWLVLLDGHRMQLRQFDILNLNLLPVSTDQIDSVEVTVYPGLTEGLFTAQGMIHIHRKKIERGLSIRGQTNGGNTIGDPGPYRYTKYRSENVDRIAADDSYWMSYAGKNGHLGLGYYSQVYYPTDERIVERNRQIYPYSNPHIRTYSFSFRGGVSVVPGSPLFNIAFTRLQDFYFFKPLGREIPVKNYFGQVGIQGSILNSKSASLSYIFDYSRNDLNKRNNIYHLDFDWHRQILSLQLHSRIKSRWGIQQFGVVAERRTIKSDFTLSKPQINRASVYAGIVRDLIKDNRQEFDFYLGYDGKDLIMNISVQNQWQINKSNQFSGILSYTQTSVREANAIWYWSQNGYKMINENGGSFILSEPMKTLQTLAAHLFWKRLHDKFPELEFGCTLQHFICNNLEDQTFEYLPGTKTVQGPVFIYSGISNFSAARLFIRLNYSALKYFRQYLYYHHTFSLSDPAHFKNIWKSRPKHRLTYRVIFKPVESFSIWLMCQYLSHTFWNDYQQIAKQSSGLYSADIADVLLIDLAVNKWLWKKQIKIDLVFRNILNQQNIYHPIGASLDLRFYAQAAFYMNFN